jgi:L-asparagine oxygenase
MDVLDFDRDALSDVTVTLTDEESREVRSVCRAAATALATHELDDEQTMTTVEQFGWKLPRRLTEALIMFRRAGNDYGTLVLRNLPIDAELPSTPADGASAGWQQLPVATMVQLACISHLGDVIGYADEKGGRLVQDVIPIAGAEHRQENSGSVYLELHTEDGFHPFKPDFLTLLALRPDHHRRGYTLTGAIRRVLPRLSNASVETLYQPLFRIRHSSSFAGAGTPGWTIPVPVLSGLLTDPELVADFHAMEPMTADAEDAFEELRRAMSATLVGAALDPGTMLVVDNRAAVHGRTAITARYDGNDRWLRRCFAVADLHPSRGSRPPGSRVCRPLAQLPAITPVRNPLPAAPLRPLAPAGAAMGRSA